MTSAVEFILIPKTEYIRSNSYPSAILNNSNIKDKSAQLSVLNRFRSLQPKDETLENEDHETEDANQKSTSREEILKKLSLLPPTKYARAEKILDMIEKSTRIVIDDKEKVRIDKIPSNLSVSILLYNLQQPNKKIDDDNYFKLLDILSVNENLVMKSNAKAAIRKNIEKPSRKRITPQKQSKTKSKPEQIKSAPLKNLNKIVTTPLPKDLKPLKKIASPRKRRVGILSQSERKHLEAKYTSGSAAYGSVRNLQKATNLKPRKVIKFLEGKNSYTKNKKFRKTFPRLKVIAYSINEIWSLDLAHVDKLAPYNRDVKYLLVAVDCLSRYLRVKPLRSKYATVTPEGFKRMIKNKQLQKVWVDAGSEFKGSFKTLCEKKQIQIYKTFSEKKVGFRRKKYSFFETFDI